MELGQLVELLKRNAELAVTFDVEGNKEAAIYHYLETASQITAARHLNKDMQVDLSAFESKAQDYVKRAEVLKTETYQAALDLARKAHDSSGDFERAKFCLVEALDLDENGQEEEAVDLYAEAVRLCLKAKDETKDDKLKTQLSKYARQALERAEKIKGRQDTTPQVAAGATSSPISKARQRYGLDGTPLGIENLSLGEGSSTTKTQHLGRFSKGGGYSEEEKQVLKKTSMINGREYVPFLSDIDLRERFAYPMPFSDAHGKLALSPKQKAKLVKWARPDEFMSNPTVLYKVGPYSVKQTLVSDCSFVASIAISAQFEEKFGKKLITSIIYPQDKNGVPVYNPCGKYMVKLRINGVNRKVVVDDYFPLGPHGEPLCSYSVRTYFYFTKNLKCRTFFELFV